MAQYYGVISKGKQNNAIKLRLSGACSMDPTEKNHDMLHQKNKHLSATPLTRDIVGPHRSLLCYCITAPYNLDVLQSCNKAMCMRP